MGNSKDPKVEKPNEDVLLPPEEAAKLIVEVETVIEAIKNGEIEGEYFEF